MAEKTWLKILELSIKQNETQLQLQRSMVQRSEEFLLEQRLLLVELHERLVVEAALPAVGRVSSPMGSVASADNASAMTRTSPVSNIADPEATKKRKLTPEQPRGGGVKIIKILPKLGKTIRGKKRRAIKKTKLFCQSIKPFIVNTETFTRSIANAKALATSSKIISRSVETTHESSGVLGQPSHRETSPLGSIKASIDATKDSASKSEARDTDGGECRRRRTKSCSSTISSGDNAVASAQTLSMDEIDADNVAVLNQLKTMMTFEHRLRAAKFISERLIQFQTEMVRMLVMGGGAIFFNWLTECKVFKVDSEEGVEEAPLVSFLLGILDYAPWTPAIVRQCRFDKLLRKLYKKYNANIDALSKTVSEVLKDMWERYRSMYKSDEEKEKDDNDHNDPEGGQQKSLPEFGGERGSDSVRAKKE